MSRSLERYLRASRLRRSAQLFFVRASWLAITGDVRNAMKMAARGCALLLEVIDLER
jgi:hypothetical protein